MTSDAESQPQPNSAGTPSGSPSGGPSPATPLAALGGATTQKFSATGKTDTAAPPGGGAKSEGGKSPEGKPGQPGKAPERKHDTTRETIESIVFAFILAFLFRTFEAEAFVIPTGSMAPTLYGQNRDVTCQQCGMRFAVSASEEIRDGLLDQRERAYAAVCANCRYPNVVVEDQIFNGDRILVNKFPYEFSAPDRWDVVVFKYPEEAKTNYIKRLAGLPGEEVLIEWGDVRVRKEATQPFRIPRKTPEKQRTLQLLVYDDNHAPQALLKAGYPERWAPLEGSRWATDGVRRTYRADPDPADPDRVNWLRYRNYVPSSDDWARALADPVPPQPAAPPRPQLITDFYAYNAKITMPQAEFFLDQDRAPDISSEALGIQWVNDLTVSAKVEVLEPAGELLLELVEGKRRYLASIDLKTGQLQLSYKTTEFREEEEEVKLVEATTPLKAAGEYEISFANVDDRLCLWVDNRLIKAVEFDPNSRYAPQIEPIVPTERDLAPVAIGARGAKVLVSNLLLERDIYYRYAGQNHDEEYHAPSSPEELRDLLASPQDWFDYYNSRRKRGTFKLADSQAEQDAEFFVLGDNSPRSRDSRLWTSSPAVPRRLMIGKAFFIYWPHGVPFLNGGKGYPVRWWEERRWDDRLGEHVRAPARPPSPKFTVPFYPQVSRMKRIR